MGWFFKSLQGKASTQEVELLRKELKDTRDFMYSQLATKQDIKDLKDTINKLLDIQLSRTKKWKSQKENSKDCWYYLLF